jgi:hypothetical protein
MHSLRRKRDSFSHLQLIEAEIVAAFRSAGLLSPASATPASIDAAHKSPRSSIWRCSIAKLHHTLPMGTHGRNLQLPAKRLQVNRGIPLAGITRTLHLSFTSLADNRQSNVS